MVPALCYARSMGPCEVLEIRQAMVPTLCSLARWARAVEVLEMPGRGLPPCVARGPALLKSWRCQAGNGSRLVSRSLDGPVLLKPWRCQAGVGVPPVCPQVVLARLLARWPTLGSRPG
jgi:hypothetical protein